MPDSTSGAGRQTNDQTGPLAMLENHFLQKYFQTGDKTLYQKMRSTGNESPRVWQKIKKIS